MQNTRSTHTSYRQAIPVVTAALITLLGLYLLWVALHLRLDYFDSYEALLNSRAIAILDRGGSYFLKRPFIFPILFVPVFILEYWITLENFSFIASHISCVLIFFVLLWVFYRFLRLEFQKPQACLGTCLMAANPLLIHFAPFAKEDICSTLFATTAFYFYWRARLKGKTKFLFLSGFFITLAMGTRYNLIPILFGILILYEILSHVACRNPSDTSLKNFLPVKIYSLLIFPIALYFLLSASLYTVMGLSPWTTSLQKFFQDLIMQYLMNTNRESSIWNYIFLAKLIPFPLHIFALYGLFTTLKERGALPIFHAVWFFAFFIFQTYVIAVKEARYLFPLLPPVYYFVIRGVFDVFRLIENRVSSSKIKNTVIMSAFCLGIVFIPAQQAVSECLKFNDRVYSFDLPGKISRSVLEISGNSKIFWLGPYYPIHPKNYVFDSNDKVTYIYHFYGRAIQFYTKKYFYHLPVSSYHQPEPNNQNAPLLLELGARQYIQKGDVIILNREPSPYVTSYLPKTLQPLLIERVNEFAFEKKVGGELGRNRYFSTSLPAAGIETKLLDAGYAIQGFGIPDGPYEIYVQLEESQNLPVSFGFLNVTGGRFGIVNEHAKKDYSIQKISLLFYDSVKTFSLEDIYRR